MTQRFLRRPRRIGFTLIELLVVIAIIAILVSLTTAAVMQVLRRVDQVRTRSDISQLHEAVVNFQTKNDVNYIPSRIRLLDSGLYDLTLAATGQPNNQLDYDSYKYLKMVWPRLQFPIQWNPLISNGDVILTGDQCLVFFLGGIQSTQPGSPPLFACLGFSTDGTNPAKLGGDRVAPFYEFKNSRLTQVPYRIDPATGQPLVGTNGYFSYLDPYNKQPYLFFSAYKASNGYNRYAPTTDCPTVNRPLPPLQAPNGPADPPIAALPFPYCDAQTPPTYYNRDGFQIISAGADKIFGPGNVWVQSQASTVPQPERDDMTNFYDKPMGNP